MVESSWKPCFEGPREGCRKLRYMILSILSRYTYIYDPFEVREATAGTASRRSGASHQIQGVSSLDTLRLLIKSELYCA